MESIDLSENNFSCVTNLQWLPHLSSLKQLELNSVNLSKDYDWVEEVNRLPYLTKFSLSSRDLPPTSLSTHTRFNYSKSLTANLKIAYQNPWEIFVTLSSLSLSDNKLSGQLVNSSSLSITCLGVQTAKDSLEMLNLSLNQIMGSVPEFSTHFHH